jgi:hypothetical protein
MPSEAAQRLAADAAKAVSPEEKLAAMITLEAVEPEGILQDPGLVMLAAETIEGEKLALELQRKERLLRDAAAENTSAGAGEAGPTSSI